MTFSERDVDLAVEMARQHCVEVLTQAGVDGNMLATAIMVWEAHKLAQKAPDLDRPSPAAAPAGQPRQPGIANTIWLQLTMTYIGRYWDMADDHAPLGNVLAALWADTFNPVHLYQALIYMLSGGQDPGQPGALLNQRGGIILEALRNPVAGPTIG